MHLICTLYNAILRIARNFLETRENIKILTHPFYHINLDWFSWEWSKKKFSRIHHKGHVRHWANNDFGSYKLRNWPKFREIVGSATKMWILPRLNNRSSSKLSLRSWKYSLLVDLYKIDFPYEGQNSRCQKINVSYSVKVSLW